MSKPLIQTTGRRKEAVARVRLRPGTGKILVNGREFASYFPILSVQQYEGRNLIVLWAPGGQNRPYKAPRTVTTKTKEYHYYIRRYSSTVELKANSEDEQELLRLTATVPFDDRQCHQAELPDLRLPLIQSYLKEVGSDLYRDSGKIPLVDLARQMNIVEGSDEYVKPRNVGILFFHEEPKKFLPGAQIEAGVMPGAANLLVHYQALGEGPVIMGAMGADGEDLTTAADQ